MVSPHNKARRQSGPTVPINSIGKGALNACVPAKSMVCLLTLPSAIVSWTSIRLKRSRVPMRFRGTYPPGN